MHSPSCLLFRLSSLAEQFWNSGILMGKYKSNYCERDIMVIYIMIRLYKQIPPTGIISVTICRPACGLTLDH